MKYIVREKFEVATAITSPKKAVVGGSYHSFVKLEIDTLSSKYEKLDLYKLEDKIRKIIDRFDHCIVVSTEDDNIVEFIKTFSHRRVFNKLPIDRTTIAKIIYNEVRKLIKENKLYKKLITLEEVITNIDNLNYEISVTSTDITKKSKLYTFSEASLKGE